ncbi:MAG: ankyrin repeat domain-containing protein [Planctomycetota bacterium]
MNDDTVSLQRAISTLAPKDFSSWLTVAAQEGKLAAIQVLLVANADVNYANEEGETPLSFACSNNQFEAAKLLHSHGADVNAKLSSGITPLDVACCWSSPQFRDWLCSVGAIRHGDWDPWPWPPDQA